jgi:GT2 family glycosyltransferase
MIANKLEEIFKQSTGFTLVGNRLLDFDTGWNTIEKVVYPYLEGYFLAFKKSEWTTVGGFDERFMPFDFEDVDISTTYVAGGGKLVFLDAEMLHLGAQSYKYSPEREAQTKANQEKFRQKWT